MNNLELKFQNELILKMARAKKECRYIPTRFNQMLAQYGGVDTAKRLIDNYNRTGNPSNGFTTLYLEGRLDLTMEDSVCKPEYAVLFTENEIAQCRKMLAQPT